MVGALGIMTSESCVYSARPVLISGSCKQESELEHAKLIKTTLDGVSATKLRIVCIASDGESRRGEALINLTFKRQLDPDSPIFPYLCSLPLMNLEVGDNDITADKNYKHVFKRLRNLVLRLRGFQVHGIHITTTTIRSHLRCNNIFSVRSNNILNTGGKGC
jgi:hypothetical protein